MIQQQVINYILNTKDSSIITLNNLNTKFFSDCKDEFNFINNHLKQYGTICDEATFYNVFPDFDKIEVNEPASYLLNTLYDDYKTQELSKIINNIISAARQGKPVNELIEMGNKIQECQNVASTIECIDLFKDKSRLEEYNRKTQNFENYYVTTGFKELDDIIGGIDRTEELATIVARTGIGKSYISLKMAIASAQQGLNVGLYSGEMTANKVGYRADTILGHVNNGMINHGNSNIQLEYAQYMEKMPTMVKGSLKVLTPDKLNRPATVSALQAFVEKEKLDILFVDQLSLLEDQRHGRTMAERMSNISADLKTLQVMKRIPIVNLCQQNREKDDEINTTQIAGSDRIGQDSTLILFLEKKNKGENGDELNITIGKARDGGTGRKLKYKTDFNTGMFIYIPGENDKNICNIDNDRYSSECIIDEQNEINSNLNSSGGNIF